jgi:hypothetical protein
MWKLFIVVFNIAAEVEVTTVPVSSWESESNCIEAAETYQRLIKKVQVKSRMEFSCVPFSSTGKK